MSSLADFAAGAGHEINNPLAIISGHAQILLANAQTPEEKRHLSAIISQVKRAYEMIADIRTYSRPPEPQISTINLDAFFEKLVSDYNSNPPIPNVEVIVERSLATSSDYNVQTDPQQLRLVFDALIRNAAETSEIAKRIVTIKPRFISDEKKGGHWSIIIEDNGPGIPAEIREHLFFPYFSGREFGRGLGFGLPKSWAIMKNMGGNLSLDKEKTSYRFLVELP